MSFFPWRVGVLDCMRVSSTFTTLNPSSLDLFVLRGFSIVKCGKQESIFLYLFFSMRYYSSCDINPCNQICTTKSLQFIPTTCERDRYRRRISSRMINRGSRKLHLQFAKSAARVYERTVLHEQILRMDTNT